MKPNRGFKPKVSDFRTHETQANTIKQSVEVRPLKYGGASFKTHKLVKVSPSAYCYKPTIGVVIFGSIFAIIGYGIVGYNFWPLINSSETFLDVEWFLILFGSIFAAAATIMFYSILKPRVFDKKANLYYQSYNKDFRNTSILKQQLPLNAIIALQIIGEHVRGKKSTYKSFELNLIVSDGSRRNVVDHGNLKSIIKDAQELETFLNVPIWHATSHLEL